ncbi:LysR substrate binding domain-containing protein [Kribbella orskensis]|uniref:LysR substrate binding domain-containing protein n=1 Tax=Kribbella orskensis TaxID=2512216 RepID=A0ABY2BQG9_9ACTN|nr:MULTISPECIES: LysR family transcriptional regulator substrate-binding protein [Kribbella]TCN41897.1 LysR substrate binding domain-containing protein [Kribbella sp. VKM Ac-2500]TCO25775.1 LysR substrate binding domain-containing protein [Kribbella orskensis]
MTAPDERPSFRLAYVPGVTPAKWVRTWNERLPKVPLTLIGVTAPEAADVVRAGGADAGLVRLPIDRTGLSAIPLYTETTVVVVPKDHLVTAAEEVTTDDLADEFVLHPLDDSLEWDQLPGQPAFERPATTAAAIELVAAGAGVLVVPQSLARLHHRKDLTYRPITDAPQSRVALTWLEDQTTDLMEQFIGIVRGRTVNSSRDQPTPPQPKRKRPESEARKPAPRKRRASDAASSGKRGKPRRPR